MMSQPFASHAAGTVSQTSAESEENLKTGPENKEIKHTQVRHGTYFSRYLIFSIFPQAAKKVDN